MFAVCIDRTVLELLHKDNMFLQYHTILICLASVYRFIFFLEVDKIIQCNIYLPTGKTIHIISDETQGIIIIVMNQG